MILYSRLLSAALPALFICWTGDLLSAQPPTVPPLKKPVRKPASASKSANVRRGSIESIDPTVGKLALKSAAGKPAEYELTEKTHYWKDRRAVDAAAFKTGDTVVVHLRHSRTTDLMQVTELDDRASWSWLDTMRHRTTPVTVTAIDDDTLTVAVGADNLPFSYALNANTLWSRGGKMVQPADFKTGDRIYVVPRALPGGDVQVRAVADTPVAATLLKERASTSVHGTIKALDPAAHTLTLNTTRDTRILTCDADLEVVRGGKPLTWSDLKAGQNITARLKRSEGEAPLVWRITLQSARTKSSSKRKKR